MGNRQRQERDEEKELFVEKKPPAGGAHHLHPEVHVPIEFEGILAISLPMQAVISVPWRLLQQISPC